MMRSATTTRPHCFSATAKHWLKFTEIFSLPSPGKMEVLEPTSDKRMVVEEPSETFYSETYPELDLSQSTEAQR